MTLGAIHQFHSGAAGGDAITNQMLQLQRRLRRLGYFSEVYAQYIDESMSELIKPLDAFVEMPSTALLVHHSMGHTAFDQLMALSVPMVTVFHSITPASFFRDEEVRRHIGLGFDQLRRLARRSEFGIAVSNHNRQQMYDAGFATVEVMPVRTDFSEYRAANGSGSHSSDDWLFVGRVVPNKCQIELVRAHAIHRRSGGSGQLHLVGDISFTPYVDEVRFEVDRLGCGDDVVLHGKVGQQQLVERYRDAGLFVCASEHEGFGVPLLEAMAAGLPVVARDEAAAAETMGGAGVLLRNADPSTIAAAVRVVESDDALRARLVAHQDERLSRIENFDVDSLIVRVVDRLSGGQVGTTIQVQGPFETSYSLAILNRELAVALDVHGDVEVSIHATEGPGDYTPDPADLAVVPAAAVLYERSRSTPYPEVAVRQMFPPRVDDSTAGMTFQYFGWEETRLPGHVVDDFNRHLDGIGTMSSFVKGVLEDCGVSIPIRVVGVGAHAPDPVAMCDQPELAKARRLRFLHVSSAFPRKGVDVLLRAYFESFDELDDTTLVLKTFPNPHNEVEEQLAVLRDEYPNGPHVCWIDRDLDRRQLDGLYNSASAYVHASRGEGFGLPVAEAMLAGVPVISVASTGLADFVNSSTAAVIGHSFVQASTHLSVPGSQWAEPSLDDLKRELVAFAEGDNRDLVAQRVDAARSLIRDEFNWNAVATRWHDFIVEQRAARLGITVAAVTTFNSRCGIAEYAANLYGELEGWVHAEVFADDNAVPVSAEHEARVRRVWTNDRVQPVDVLIDALNASPADLLHIQYNFGFFTASELGRLISIEVARRPVVVTIHRTVPLQVDDGQESMGDIADELCAADAVIVHQQADRRRLADVGVVENVHVIPIGTDPPAAVDSATSRQRLGVPLGAFIVATFGFLLPHKGMLPLLRAVAELRARHVDAWLIATCALHPDPSSSAHLEEVIAEIERLDLGDYVMLVTEFLDQDDALDRLGAADVIVMPYEQTNESASAAIRFVLPLGRAMVTSDVPIFEDLVDFVPRLSAPVDPDELSDLLEELWLDDERRHGVARNVAMFSEATSWVRTSARTREVYNDALNRRAAAERTAVGESLATTESVE